MLCFAMIIAINSDPNPSFSSTWELWTVDSDEDLPCASFHSQSSSVNREIKTGN